MIMNYKVELFLGGQHTLLTIANATMEMSYDENILIFKNKINGKENQVLIPLSSIHFITAIEV